MVSTTKETFIRCKNYQDANSKSSGYQNEYLIEKLLDNNKKNPPWKKKDTNFFINQRELELCSALMWIINKKKLLNLKVSDIGGGNGYLFFSMKKFIPKIDLSWSVYESKKMSIAYSQFEKESGIKWYSSERKLSEFSDIALFSCVLQYLEYPFKIMKKFAIRNKYIIITRIPFIDDNKGHVITRQTFPDKGDYQTKNTSWPSWFFHRNNFMKEVSKIGNVIYQWKTPTEIVLFEGKYIMLEGMLIESNKKK